MLRKLIAAAVLLTATTTAMPEVSPWQAAGWGNAATENATSPDFVGSMHAITHEVIDADLYWAAGFDGAGVDIAMIDTGTVPVSGLDGRVRQGPDLSLDAPFPSLNTLDGFGHGTHLAGIAVGNADDSFVGVAPAATLVNIKVGAYNGALDVSQVIAAVDWVIEHRTTASSNIRVLLLAYGTDGDQDYQIDPLSDAVERAWRAGIVVVVAAGNDGNKSDLRNPATNPFVITVGATDLNGTADVSDDRVAEFSACGTAQRSPDLVAPGSSVVSLRSPGSYLDLAHPEARVGEDYFLGSGTSQAAAMVAGAAALVIDQHPTATPDEVKHHLVANAHRLQGSNRCQGAGQLDLEASFSSNLAEETQNHADSNGGGLLEEARGSFHLTFGDQILEGEVTLFEWEPYLLFLESAKASVEAGIWSGNSWGGNSWGGNSWGGNSWGGNSWGGNSWGGNSWGGNTWS